MTIFFVQGCRNHTFPESPNCPIRYLGEVLHASLQDGFGKCCYCFHDECQDDD